MTRPRTPTGLANLLQRAHLRVTLLAIALVGVSLLVVALFSLRAYVSDNLQLAARMAAYNVEAPMVFGDRDAAREALAVLGHSQPIAAIHARDTRNAHFVSWEAPTSALRALEQAFARFALGGPSTAPVQFHGQPLGTVEVHGSGRDLLSFIGIGLLCVLLCVALSGLAALRMSRRASRRIAAPLQELARTISAARQARQFHVRVGGAGITELQQLGDDFNALLAELERWQAQLRQESESLEYLARHDPLTGLANRRRFQQELEERLLAASLENGRLAVLFIDGDDFKTINDELGHEAGDEVLRVTAHRLRAQVRDNDLIARLGGDEFAVVLGPFTDGEQASRVAGDILCAMRNPIALPGGRLVNTTLSIGIALYPRHGEDAASLVRAADTAMYRVKQGGRNDFRVAEPIRPTLGDSVS
ncbi:diguanylate cyclase [Pseudothauera nasutitermitis]|uniref:Diguanylate cyclase n=1 Tax=Pseudothauera nasutitermitis TaxID=2565930 RepID=A0A4S4ASD3_9RHOO|nr:sensor domain-containing diguanylate cyclase [Pseudothauera nasutitermitis]THF62314.1 diguanylate cyclase [Pseudothauera nasutitermitis]